MRILIIIIGGSCFRMLLGGMSVTQSVRGREGKWREGKGWEGKGREGKEMEGKGRERNAKC